VIANPPALRVSLPLQKIADFCQRWSIGRLEVFGSVLREDFRPDSDLDFVATYLPKARWSLLDRVRMKLELEAMLGREVDLLNRRALERPQANNRAALILAQAETIYAGT
jgi:hypothetical protein